MDTILEALRALKEDLEIIPLTDKEKEEITESNETKYLLGFSHNSLLGNKKPFVVFDDIKNYQESEEDGVKTFSFEDKDTRYKYIGNDEIGYKEIDNRGPKMDFYRIAGRRTVKRNYPYALDKKGRIGYKPATNPTGESLNEVVLNKDFYEKLPSFACEHLDTLIVEHGEEDGFEDAGNKYRNHILNSDIKDMKMPGLFFDFNKHVDARTKGAIKKGGIDSETGHSINLPKMNEDLIIVEADKVKDKLYALKDEIEKAEGNLKFFLADLFAVYMYHAFGGGTPKSSDERDELKAKGISTDELIHSDLTRKEGDELSEWEKGLNVEFKKE